MRYLLVFAFFLAGCGPQCDTLFRDWSVSSCPSGDFCLSPLNLSGSQFGSNTLTVTEGDGSVCTFEMIVNSNGSDTTSGTGTLTNGQISGNYSQADFQQCSELNDISYSWSLGCSQLTITNAAGTVVYE